MEVAGLALSAVSLSFELFGGCVEGFVLLSNAQNFGRDASFLRTMLNVEEYRFVKWADAVGLTEPGAKLLPQVNKTLAEELMVQLGDRLDASRLKERYSLEVQPGDFGNSTDENKREPGILAGVSEERRREILARARLLQGQGLSKRLRWAAIDKARFQALVQDVREIVDALWHLLEPIQLRVLSQQVGQTLTAVVDMSHDINALKGLHASLTRKGTATIPSFDILESAVGLKVVREQLPAESDTQQPRQSPNNDPIKPLDRSLLKRVTTSSYTTAPFIAEYDGKPVICEAKVVPARLKPKLRLRAQNLATLLSLPKSSRFLTLRCLGFIEDQDEFVFVYEYPAGSDTLCPPRSLQDLMRDAKSRLPSLTTRLGMALEICRTLLTVHTAGWLHKNVRSENILFFSDSTSSGGVSNTLTRPYLAGFAFSRVDSPVEVSDQASEDPLLDIYRHPQGLGEPSVAYAMYMDHYSLGMVLAEIAEWRSLKHIVKKQVDVTNRLVDVPLSALAGIQAWFWRELVERGQIEFRMGEVYGRMVSYLTRPDREDQTERTESLLELEEFVNELGCCRV
ncbi:hypothetical protein ASPVEDRAFT_72790 [Aspergillus versicolor CBS 583.65]|uniref:Protein kinase domain-containing protein n=1 Tax=Aspergillus versicolor CBS 583.65 TaxID=1036611 RepID=A0A1L9PND0_ASPVE|nr:uncharacterized protein ASPVEDRAFT_72790 [Aspergillus versicolor CBS 583.65]OJJ03030.1 hypothetical protein ASPVEDRAFT_72790 [Aspergillus versicolor CBS 583.65]